MFAIARALRLLLSPAPYQRDITPPSVDYLINDDVDQDGIAAGEQSTLTIISMPLHGVSENKHFSGDQGGLFTLPIISRRAPLLARRR